jgi:hypothetical protein
MDVIEGGSENSTEVREDSKGGRTENAYEPIEVIEEGITILCKLGAL